MSKTYDKKNKESNNDPEFEKALQKAKEKSLQERKEKEEDLDELTGAYKSAQTTGFYNYITEIDNKSMFHFVVAGITVFTLVNKIHFTMSSIVAIFVAGVVVYFLNERRRTTQVTDMKELEIKLVRITPNPKYFHLDAGIVELVYSIREFRNYNDQAFVEMIAATDKFLGLMYDIEHEVANCHHAVELAQDLKKQALNHLMSIIYRTPSDSRALVKLRKAADSLHFILNHHIDIATEECNKQIKKIGLNASNKLIKINQPTGFDANYHSSFDIF